MEVPIDEIRPRKHNRNDLGDVVGLAASIEELGLIEPIVLHADMTLICGQRRIAAYRHMKKTTIEANIATDPRTLAKYIKAQAAENTERKALEPDEAFAIGQDVETIARKEATKAQAEGQKKGAAKGGQTAGRGRPIASRQKKPRGKQDESKRASAVAAAAVGMSRTKYEQIKVVKASGNQRAIKHMKTTRKVKAAHDMVTGNSTDPSEWKSMTISRAYYERLMTLKTEFLKTMKHHDATISISHVRDKANCLCEHLNKLRKPKKEK